MVGVMCQHLGLGYLPCKDQDADLAHQARPQQPGDGDVIEGIAQPHHRHDEADGTPGTDAPVMRGVLAEICQRGRLHQRHRGAPEETHQHQHQEQAPEAGGSEHPQIEQCAQTRRHLHYQQALAGMVGQPAPDVGREHAHHRRDRHQDGDLDGIEVDGLQVQTPVGREHPHEGVVEEIESGDAPVIVLGGRHKKKLRNGAHYLTPKIFLPWLLKSKTPPQLATSRKQESRMEQNENTAAERATTSSPGSRPCPAWKSC